MNQVWMRNPASDCRRWEQVSATEVARCPTTGGGRLTVRGRAFVGWGTLAIVAADPTAFVCRGVQVVDDATARGTRRRPVLVFFGRISLHSSCPMRLKHELETASKAFRNSTLRNILCFATIFFSRKPCSLAFFTSSSPQLVFEFPGFSLLFFH